MAQSWLLPEDVCAAILWHHDYAALEGGQCGVSPAGTANIAVALAAQYESWSLPMAVILIVPMCLLSAIVGILLRGTDEDHAACELGKINRRHLGDKVTEGTPR